MVSVVARPYWLVPLMAMVPLAAAEVTTNCSNWPGASGCVVSDNGEPETAVMVLSTSGVDPVEAMSVVVGVEPKLQKAHQRLVSGYSAWSNLSSETCLFNCWTLMSFQRMPR